MTIKKLATVSSGTPLMALSAAIIDTETTGLNARKDQIIQIGGVKLDKGVPTSKPVLNTFVKAKKKIPETVSRLTGISKNDVAYAPEFNLIKPLLEAFISTSVVIGHHINFDIMVIQNECKRFNLEWPRTRLLDTSHLAQIVEPGLRDYSLDVVMDYLDISEDSISKRHTALGDALITREVFLRLVPRLRGAGIRTLSEAENAIARLPQNRKFKKTNQSSKQDTEDYIISQLDGFPYSHRVKDIMSDQLVTLKSDALVADALKTLLEKKTSSVLLNIEDIGHEKILTEKDILLHINKSSNASLNVAAKEIASVPITSVNANDFVYKAIGRMARLELKHLLVRDEYNKVVGIVTNRDLLGQRSVSAVSLGDGLEAAQTIEELAAVWAELPLLASSLQEDKFGGIEVAAIISHELITLTRRAAEMAARDMINVGRGEPPCPFCVMVLGSGGRGESLLAMDQDNALVYKGDGTNSDIDGWFEEFGTRMNGILDTVGVPLCTGEIMVRNKAWRKSLDDWKTHIDHWVEQSSPEGILNADIFFDGIPAYGDYSLGRQILRYAFTKADLSKQFQFFLSVSVQRMKPALGMFGGLKTDSHNRIDLKAGGLLPIVSGARILAMRHKHFKDHSTSKRLNNVLLEKDVSQNDIEDIIQAHSFMMDLILRQQLEDILKGVSLSTKVSPGLLSNKEQRKLIWSFEKVSAIKHQVGGAYLPS